jgi:DNA-damage-inducible protein D
MTKSDPAKIAVFEGKHIRKTLHDGEWWFSVADVIVVLTNTSNANDYIKKMRKRDSELSKGWGQIVTPLWLSTEGGKQKMNCARAGRSWGKTERLFTRITRI